MPDMAFPQWPSFTQEEADAVQRVLLSNRVNYWTGEEGRAFEREFAAFAETEHAIAVANGTVALELALKGLGIGPGDEVVVTPRSFIASVSAVVTAGAIPVFAEIDRDSQNITADTISAVITARTKAVICVHLAGWPCDMSAISELAREHALYVIEDCAQAHGATWHGRPVGGLGHVGCWSFCQDKIMTTGGEGGMVTTNDPALWKRMWAYKDHGKSWDAVYASDHSPGFRWLHESFGSNWRLTEMQAAIGRIQLAKLGEWSYRRRRNASILADYLSPIPALRVPFPPKNLAHAYYKFYAFVRPERVADNWTRDRIVCEINNAGVPCAQGSCPEVYLEKAFDGTGWRPESRLPIARELGETSLMFPVHPTLHDSHMEHMADIVREVMCRSNR